MPAKAASAAVATGATKVTTVRLWDASDETSRIVTCGTAAIASRIWLNDLGPLAFGEIGNAFDERHVAQPGGTG